MPVRHHRSTRSGVLGHLPARARRAQLDGYLARIVERDFYDQGHHVRKPATLRAWLRAYAAATATTTAYNAIMDAATLLEITPQRRPHGRVMIGQLFESLVALSLRAYTQTIEADIAHLRTRNADHEIDFIITGPGGRILALEVKLARTVDDNDVTHLHWLHNKVGDLLADAAIITTGPYAYRRPDGIAVIPASLLGP